MVAVKFKAAVNLEVKDPEKSAIFFGQALSLAFDYQKSELVPYYGEFAVQLVKTAHDSQSRALAAKTLQTAISLFQDAVKQEPREPTLWYGLSNLYVAQARLLNQPVNPQAEASALQAVALAPKRVEVLYFLVQALILEKKYEQAVVISRQITEILPDSGQARWRLGEAYAAAGNNKQAMASAAMAISLGFNPSDEELKWFKKISATK